MEPNRVSGWVPLPLTSCIEGSILGWFPTTACLILQLLYIHQLAQVYLAQLVFLGAGRPFLLF